MKTNEKLNGTLVLVHPQLENDLAGRQGKVAVVNYDRQQSNEVYVGFTDGAEAIYRPEQLLKLKSYEEIRQDLADNGPAMKPDDFGALYKIMMLQERGTAQANWSSLEIARDNPGILDRALEPARQEQGLDLQHGVER